jgi:Raf kinase inhibitor-like YbhB/YbcL family protein
MTRASASITLAVISFVFYVLLTSTVWAESALRDGEKGGALAFTLSSPSFHNGEQIPKKFTCDGADVSPQLQWSSPPSGAQSFVLIADDPDAPVGTWTHWIYFDMPGQITSLPENVDKVEQPPSAGHQGRNDFRKIGYGGPCPPVGKPHRYFFKIYALDKNLNLKAGAGRQEVEQAMQGHIIGQAEIFGKYQR